MIFDLFCFDRISSSLLWLEDKKEKGYAEKYVCRQWTNRLGKKWLGSQGMSSFSLQELQNILISPLCCCMMISFLLCPNILKVKAMWSCPSPGFVLGGCKQTKLTDRRCFKVDFVLRVFLLMENCDQSNGNINATCMFLWIKTVDRREWRE